MLMKKLSSLQKKREVVYNKNLEEEILIQKGYIKGLEDSNVIVDMYMCVKL